MSRALYVLGTGHAMVTRCYNACFALREGDDFFLLDAGGGNGILAAAEAMELPWEAVRHMFLTHPHTDHVLGGIWAVRAAAHSLLAGRRDAPFTVWAHPGLLETFRSMCLALLPSPAAALLGGPIRLNPVLPGARAETPFGSVTFFDTGCTSVVQLGCAFRLPDGTALSYLGDEPMGEAAEPYVRGADWVITEALCLYEERAIHHPYETLHSTVRDACTKAQALGVRHLVLSHCEDSHGPRRKARYLREGRQFYTGDLHVPDDREILSLM